MFRFLILAAGAASSLLASANVGRAWERNDSPLAAVRPSADLGGAYLFLDPNANDFVILAATLGGGIAPSQNANQGFFDHKTVLRFEIDNSEDAKIDRFIEVKFSQRTSPSAPQTATIKLPTGGSFTAPTTISRAAFGPPGPPTFGGGTSAQQVPTVTTHGPTGVSFFGGLVDDPFYFDLAAFEAYRASRLAGMTNPAILTRGRDSFSGYNTMAVVLRVPLSALVGPAGTIGLSVTTKGAGVKDRAGHPFVNGLLIDHASRDAYNAGKPTQDRSGKFLAQITTNLFALQTSATYVDILAQLVSAGGDMLRVNPSIANTGTEGGTNPVAGYPNGRRPNDDVVDTFLTMLNGGAFQGDAVNDNEFPMRDAFPFFASPHMPYPPGAGAEDLTRN